MARFADILTIVNGKNQKKVENPNGKYPIYGSGGIMGYADDYICEAETVVIGRKGSINNPIFVETPFWNVDTAFGLHADCSKLFPKYLYYFCVNYDFERLNTTVTIPSLTKANLLNVEIPLPPLEEQRRISALLDKVGDLIAKRQVQLDKLDLLVKARFVEITENSETVPTRMGDVATYINGYAFKPTDWSKNGLPIIRIQNLNNVNAEYNYFDDVLPEKYLVRKGDVLVSWATHLEAYIWKGNDAWLNQHIFKVVFDKIPINDVYFVYSTEEALRQAFRNAHGFKPTMEHIKRSDFEDAVIQLPGVEAQNEFAKFAAQVDKAKLTIQQSLDKLEVLKRALMQQYFG